MRKVDSGSGKALSGKAASVGLLLISLTAAAALADHPTVESLTLDLAIKKALANNRSVRQQRLSLRSAEITYNNAWDTMFMPTISLGLQSTSAYTLTQVPGKLADQQGAAYYSRGYPASTASLSLGKYTLFNFWKDWIVYEQARVDWQRTKEVFVESVRAIRFQVINAFYKRKSDQERLDTARRSVEISEAIVELLKSRVLRKLATSNDVNSSEVDLLNAKNEYNSRLTQSQSSLWKLNQVLGDPIDTQYEIKDTIKFVPLKMTAEQALHIYEERSPTIKNERRDLRKAELAIEAEQRNRLPLPKVSFSGVTVSYGNSYYGTRPDLYTSSSGNVNFDVAAEISLTIPIYGPGGIFNSRTVEQAYIRRDTTELNYQEQRFRDQSEIRQLITRIVQDEKSIDNYKQAFDRSSKVLDGLFTQLASQAVLRLELRDAIKQARESEIAWSESVLSHLSNKMSLAQTIGVDRLPGDPY